MAGNCASCAACRALMIAFSTNVRPVSATAVRVNCESGTTSMPERLEHRLQLLQFAGIAGGENDTHARACLVRVQRFQLPRE